MKIKADLFINNILLHGPFLFLSFIVNIIDKGVINPKTAWLKHYIFQRIRGLYLAGPNWILLMGFVHLATTPIDCHEIA
jgi:hypothetical protein